MFGNHYKTLIDDLVGRKDSIMASEATGKNVGENLVYESRDITRLNENGMGVSFYVTAQPASMSSMALSYANTSNASLNNTAIHCGDGNASICNGTEFGNHGFEFRNNFFHLENNNEMTPFTVPVYGYISPALVVFTIITNTLVCVVLMKKNMRSPTNLLLFAMALSDMFTGVFPVPCFIYFYTFGNYKDWVPYNWCFLYSAFVEYIPTIFHTASIFLTVALAAQRYIYVCHSMKARQWCTMTNSVKTIVVIYVVSILLHVCRFFEQTSTPVDLPSSLNPGQTVKGCSQDFRSLVEKYSNIYFNVYYWMRVLCIHVIPCVTLVLLNLLLILAMKSAQARRKQLLKLNRRTECRKLKENNCTTLMLVAVVGLFLLVEIPLAILFIIIIIENTFNMHISHPDDRSKAALLINFFILLSYPVNFFIYCGMSRQFRETFKRLFVPGTGPMDREHSQYMSLATANGGNTVPTNESAV